MPFTVTAMVAVGACCYCGLIDPFLPINQGLPR